MSAVWLHPYLHDFPDPESVDSPDVVAVGGDLSPERLLLAYQRGIFPWYSVGEPILWWSPDPRMVVFPDELKVSKSMRVLLNQKRFVVTCNKDFSAVMQACKTTPRVGQSGGTWINDDMIRSYTALHRAGFAHSVEVWQGDEMVGGLYGVAIGRIFYGESMFSTVTNASKFGFIVWVQKLQALGFQLIDCQQETPHLTSLGGRPIPRSAFMKIVRENESILQLL